MNGPFFDRLARQLGTSHSRRHVLGAAGKGTAAGIGATLATQSFGTRAFGRMPTLALQEEVTVDIADFAFEPSTVEVTAGDTVTWTNQGQAPHTATADDGLFDSGRLDNGGTFSHTFTTLGTVAYHCEFHPDMVATVVVNEAEQTTYVRRNVHDLGPDAQELKSYAIAVDKMRDWDTSTDPLEFVRSWRYQGNMHMYWRGSPEPTPPSPLPAGWDTCEHGFSTTPLNRFFWPWHRMYLYWFERIIRELSGDHTFALPYWDYSDPTRLDRRILPAPFLNPDSPLYIDARDSNVNLGNPPAANVPGSIFDYCSGMSLTDFTSTSDALESTPHGDIHVWVGGAYEAPLGADPTGWMYYPDRAARDPIFWLHHANVDRLWESWVELGNADPSDVAWTGNQATVDDGAPYDFFDELGNQVTTIRIVNEVVNLVDLGYQYDVLADLSGCQEFLTAPGSNEASAGTPESTPAAPLELGSITPETSVEVGPEPAEISIAVEQPESAARLDPVVLTLGGIQSEGVTAVVVEVYINLPPDQQPDFRSPYYVGNLYLFGMVPPAGSEADHSSHSEPRTQEFRIARNVQALDALGEWTGELRVTLVPYYTAAPAQNEAAGATPAAAVLPPGPWITVESFSISLR